MHIEDTLKSIFANARGYIAGFGGNSDTRSKNEEGYVFVWRRYNIKGWSKFVCPTHHQHHCQKKIDLHSTEYTDEVEFMEFKGAKRPICQVKGCTRGAQNTGKCSGVSSYRKNVGLFCENTDGRLGFTCTSTILDTCMVDGDHIDEDHSNNDPENIQYLCRCCHAYKNKLVRSGFQEEQLRFMLARINETRTKNRLIRMAA